MSKTYKQFKSEVLGRAFDVDGYYGAQCWDGMAYYEKWLGYPVTNTDIHGYACDIWESRKTNGILKNFIEVTIMQPGDIAVFKKVANWTPYSHVAIFDSDAGGGYGWFLGQNQGAYKGAFNLIKLPYSATFDTAFRPKCFVTSKPITAPIEVTEPIDQILNVGSYVTSCPMKIGNQGLKVVKGDTCCYLKELGEYGWFPIRFVSEYNAADGKKDNYLSNTNAVVFIDRCRVDAVNVAANKVMIHGIWVNAGPLIEVA